MHATQEMDVRRMSDVAASPEARRILPAGVVRTAIEVMVAFIFFAVLALAAVGPAPFWLGAG